MPKPSGLPQYSPPRQISRLQTTTKPAFMYHYGSPTALFGSQSKTSWWFQGENKHIADDSPRQYSRLSIDTNTPISLIKQKQEAKTRGHYRKRCVSLDLVFPRLQLLSPHFGNFILLSQPLHPHPHPQTLSSLDCFLSPHNTHFKDCPNTSISTLFNHSISTLSNHSSF